MTADDEPHRSAALGGDGPVLRLASAPTTGFRQWMSRRRYHPTSTDTGWIRPDPPRPAEPRPQAFAVDPVVESVLADVPGMSLPAEVDFVDIDQRRICISAGQRVHWQPGTDGNPGVPARRTVLLPPRTPVAVDTNSVAPRVLDRLDDPVFAHLRPSHVDASHPGWTSRPVRATGLVHGRSATRTALADVDLCLVDVSEHSSSIDAAYIVACAATGAVPAVVRNSTPEFERRLDPQLWAAVAQLDERRLRSDAYYRDVAGVMLRRHTLRSHAAARVWESVLGDASSGPHVTVLLSSIRPWFLGQVIGYLNTQSYRAFDLQITFDRVDVDRADVDAQLEQAEFPVTVRHNVDPLTVGENYNEMMRRSDADIVVIWDDDDHYGPHHIEDLVGGLTWSGALLAGKSAEFCYLHDRDITVQRSPQGRYGPSNLAGGTLTMWRSEAIDFGGVRPLILGHDQEIQERVRAAKRGLHRVPGYEYVLVRRGSGHTWTVDDEYFVDGSVRQWSGLALDSAGFGSIDEVTTAARYR